MVSNVLVVAACYASVALLDLSEPALGRRGGQAAPPCIGVRADARAPLELDRAPPGRPGCERPPSPVGR
jgi:hypothetical protein